MNLSVTPNSVPAFFVARVQADEGATGFLFDMKPEKTPVWEWFTPDEKWIKRFWEGVDKSAGPEACWPWMRSIGGPGYGQMHFSSPALPGGRTMVTAHRAAFMLSGGILTPEKPLVLHKCVDSRACCNFDHLYAGDSLDNSRDMVRQGRSGFHLHPELIRRGDKHHAKLRPETYKRGAQSPVAKLTEEDVFQIFVMRSTGATGQEIAKRFNVRHETVYSILNEKTWRKQP